MAMYQVVCTLNDRNGNPRRLTLRYTNNGKINGLHDNGYSGHGIPYATHKYATVLPSIDVAPAEYNRLKRCYSDLKDWVKP